MAQQLDHPLAVDFTDCEQVNAKVRRAVRAGGEGVEGESIQLVVKGAMYGEAGARGG